MTRIRFAGLVLVLCAGVVLPAAGQDLPSTTAYDSPAAPGRVAADEAIPVGPFLFSPALQLSWQDRDNIFFTPDNEVADNVYLARARFLFELPIYESYVQFSYTPQYRDFKNYELIDKWSHFATAAAAFQFASGVTLDLSYNYVDGNLETREVDPGGELLFGDPGFIKQEASLRLGYWFAPRDGLFVEGEWTDVDYDNPDLFFPYTRLFAGLGWQHQLSELLVMDLRYGRIDFDADDFVGVDNSFRDSESDEITLGLNGQLSPVVAAELRVGYRQTSYIVLPGDPPTEDYKGYVANGFISWELAHGSTLRLDALRSDYPSNFDLNAYYVATGGSLMYALDRGGFYGQLRGLYQQNDYELPDLTTGTVRSDELVAAGVGLGYRFTSILSLWGSYLYEDRGSNIYDFTYKSNVYTLGLVIGY